MKVKIKKHLLSEVSGILFHLELKGSESRHRTKFLEWVTERHNEFAEDSTKILHEYATLDESGEPVILEESNGSFYDIENVEAFNTEKQELGNEETVFDSGDQQLALRTVRRILDLSEENYSGDDAVLYNYLCEAFHVDEDIDEDLLD